VVGSTTPEVFEAYMERVLAPALRPGQVVVMNNLTAPKGERIKEMIEERSYELLFSPPYSPDFNPIEEAFRGDRRAPTKVEARPRESLVEAMSAAISAVSARDAEDFSEHCGCRQPAQLL
jgi:transposase